jgi:hypothetical protein
MGSGSFPNQNRKETSCAAYGCSPSGIFGRGSTCTVCGRPC